MCIRSYGCTYHTYGEFPTSIGDLFLLVVHEENEAKLGHQSQVLGTTYLFWPHVIYTICTAISFFYK